jgi:hypothetical protein
MEVHKDHTPGTNFMYQSPFHYCDKIPEKKWYFLLRRKDSFWFMISVFQFMIGWLHSNGAGAVYDGRENVIEQRCSPHDHQRAERETERQKWYNGKIHPSEVHALEVTYFLQPGPT